MKRSVTHGTFTIERVYDAAPARVFAAWSELDAKKRWFACHDNQAIGDFDFRVGGRESNTGGPPGGPLYAFEAWYQDIVPGERIVYSYTMRKDGERISASLVTVELEATRGGTRMTFTEQGAFLDGHDAPAQREHGTREGLAHLDAELRRAS
jgi:uncharacterized protein YndB with AHSA1/START domain